MNFITVGDDSNVHIYTYDKRDTQVTKILRLAWSISQQEYIQPDHADVSKTTFNLIRNVLEYFAAVRHGSSIGECIPSDIRKHMPEAVLNITSRDHLEGFKQQDHRTQLFGSEVFIVKPSI